MPHSPPPRATTSSPLQAATNAYDLPKADASGSYDLAAKQGKVALMRTATPLAVASPLGLANLRDFVGYGNAYADPRNSATPVTLRNKQLLPKPRR